MYNYDYKDVNECDSLDLTIEKIYQDHGYLYLNDTIGIFGGVELIKSSNSKLSKKIKTSFNEDWGNGIKTSLVPELHFIRPPYRLVFNKTDTIKIIMNNDTLYFNKKM